MSIKKFCLAINVIVLYIHKVQEVWEGQKIARVLFIDIKKVFNSILYI